MNDDAATSVNDIDAFVQALIDPAGFQAAHPTVPLSPGDMNCDGVLDGRDISGFVTKLLIA